MRAVVHPDHDEIAQAVRGWFQRPFEEMGYRAEERRWGTYWNHGHVHTLGFPPAQLGDFVRDVRSYYNQRPVYINVHGREMDRQLGAALCAAGCSKGRSDIFLAHVGTVPALPPVQGLEAEAVDESNLLQFAQTRLSALADTNERPDNSDVQHELALRRRELSGTGRGVLARIHGEPASVIWWYEDPKDIWINYLGTRSPFRRQGVASWLLGYRLLHAYQQGCRSVVINVATANVDAIRPYQRFGFRDEVCWRRRYVLRRC
jgi:GNAT superfamily N-acetyltransferase